MNIIIRDAVEADAKAIHDIYGYYAENTAVTFTEQNPSVEEYRQSIIDTKKAYPYIVACDESGKVLGMAYGGQVRHHDAYKFSVETTIYVANDAPKRQGIGSKLYTALEERLSAMGYKFMYGVITDDNEPSIALHKALGFEEVGHFKDIGYKFGKWKGIVWYRKQIGSLDDMTLRI
ncbi:phosphinothricin acetyltransferase [Pseudobutyrivibrio sp. UC1225]|uniref:GNAT family N-acetyltransferase n=1 Tax=Pseudobutyrivibrio sp. UC1225 TaxID=1798185 RepID=UPI0008ECF1D1|nr:GNAT family N-acetyltransferase [Pseudobutyrivibrio sp. UC1225]SFN40706.1 phosphinothricin acetyltransferase [Pseudobutyrivibrio sp. UC1225]